MSPLVTNLEKLSALLLSGHETWVARIAILTNTVMLVGTSSVSNRLEKKSFPTKQEFPNCFWNSCANLMRGYCDS